MNNTITSQTHRWLDGATPHEIEIDGRTILHHRCSRCARDFAQGLDGAGWQAVYIGVFSVELLSERVSERWLREECPGRFLPDDEISRATRRG
jgi:hypothetical protein